MAACVDEGVVLSIHLGSSGQLAVTAPDAPIDVMITLQPMNICQAAADLLWSRVSQGVPRHQGRLSEGGTGWIPYFLDRLDRTYDMHHLWTGQDFGDRCPSEVFRDHFLTCFIADPVGISSATGSASTTSPGSATTPTPTRRGRGPRGAGGRGRRRPRRGVNKITHENAMRWYSYDPFSVRPRSSSTVAALRAESFDHDVQIRPFDKGRFQRKTKGIEIGKLASKATAVALGGGG